MSFEEDQDGSFTTFLAEGDKVNVVTRTVWTVSWPSLDRIGPTPSGMAPEMTVHDNYFSYF